MKLSLSCPRRRRLHASSIYAVTIPLLVVAAAAGAQQPLALTDALEQARKTYPSLAAARAEVEAARARGWMLQVPYQPMASLNAFGSLGKGEMIFPSSVEPFDYTHMNGEGQGTLNGMLMWRVYSSGRDRLARRIAESDTETALENVRVEDADLAMRVRIAFSLALLRKDALAARKAAVESAGEVLRTTKVAFEAGKVPQAFVFRAQADASAMERELALARADFESATSSLKEAVGSEQDHEIVPGDWNVPPAGPTTLASAIMAAEIDRAELAGLKEARDASARRARMFDLSALPELSVTAMGDTMAFTESRPDSSYRFGVILSFPLADGGERRSDRAEQKAMADRYAAEYREARLRVQSEVASAWAMTQAAPAVKKASEDETRAGAEAYRVALLRYREGKAVLSEVIDARAQLVAAELAMAEADDYARRAWTLLERAIGR